MRRGTPSINILHSPMPSLRLLRLISSYRFSVEIDSVNSPKSWNETRDEMSWFLFGLLNKSKMYSGAIDTMKLFGCCCICSIFIEMEQSKNEIEWRLICKQTKWDLDEMAWWCFQKWKKNIRRISRRRMKCAVYTKSQTSIYNQKTRSSNNFYVREVPPLANKCNNCACVYVCLCV